MTTTQYKLQAGEHVRQVAEHFGFSSTKAIAEHPDNAALVSQRGGIDHLRPGDVVTIPEGTRGVLRVGTGRGHDVRVPDAAGTFTVRLDTGFRLLDEEHAGDLSKSPVRWFAFGKQTLTVSDAAITVSQDGGGLVFTNTTNKRGEAVFPLLEDGTWLLEGEAEEEERSTDFAKADADADHGLGFFEKRSSPTKSPAPSRSFPTNTAFEVEYRSFSLALTVEGGSIISASVTAPASHVSRPSPVLPFWLEVGALRQAQAQVLAVEWKPDFLRRVKTKLRPFQRERKALGREPEVVDQPELFAVHTTTGANISGALATFLHPNITSGAHFVNDVDGHLVRMADDRYFTKHAGGYGKQRLPNWGLGRVLDAGEPSGQGRNINDRGVGVENVHKENTKKASVSDFLCLSVARRRVGLGSQLMGSRSSKWIAS